MEGTAFHRSVSAQALAGGASTISPTMRRTTGKTTSKVGNATNHDSPQATGHVDRNSGVKPRLFQVEMAETTNVISSESTNGMMIAA